MRLILVGFGTVGRGVAECLLAAAEELAALELQPRIVAVVDPVVGSVANADGLDPGLLVERADAGEPLAAAESTDAASPMPAVLDEVGADLLVEVTPTDLESGEPGLGHIEAALTAGLDVVTTNKGPIALALPRLLRRAEEAGVSLRFEGTVMAGTPVLGLCESGLAGAGITSVRGIVNGTCNFILSEMEAGSSYDVALAVAQDKGYAEDQGASTVHQTLC